MNNNHAVLREFIDVFVDASRMERFVFLWEKPKRRDQLLDELLHCLGFFRADRSIELARPLADPALVAQRMRALGAGKTCFVFGASDADGQEADLDVVLREVVGMQREVLLYCRKSQVAFVEEHDGHQLLLHKRH